LLLNVLNVCAWEKKRKKEEKIYMFCKQWGQGLLALQNED
jgi:hypothetical protein